VLYTQTVTGGGPVPDRKPEVEGTLGLAWRPAFHQTALLVRYTYLVDDPQSTIDPTVPVYRQRSHIASVAGEVTVWRHFAFGEKVAYKSLREMDLASTGATRDPSEQAYLLWINRLSVHVTRAWDAALEYRYLFTQPTLAGENDHGALVELNRLLGGHLRIGAGWNFTGIPNDERNLGRLREHGFFVRAQGML
jgi:hypothetical protein